MAIKRENLSVVVEEIVETTPVTDVHTHLFAPEFGQLLLSGIDELLTYHYLIAESMRISPMPYSEFWSFDKKQQADFVWETLFVHNTPYSEATRGVVTVLQSLGVDLESRNLDEYRRVQQQYSLNDYIDFVLAQARVDRLVMTNDPFDSEERALWERSPRRDPRFDAALRIDPLLNDYRANSEKLQTWGYEVSHVLNNKTLSEIRRFLREWAEKMRAKYVAVSLPQNFRIGDDERSTIIREAVLPLCRELNIPFAMMIGVKRGVNPELRSAGDGVGKSEIEVIEQLCAEYPFNKFMVTMLSRENQHELTVVARKFRNLMVFGCWWFLNNPSLIEEITRIRFELLGPSVIPQHSDARVLEQLIYKWSHSRKIISRVLTDKYSDLMDAGWILERDEIERDVKKLFSQNFKDFLELRL